MSDVEKLVTAKEAAEALGITASTIKSRAKAGKLPIASTQTLGKGIKVLFRLSELQNVLGRQAALATKGTEFKTYEQLNAELAEAGV